ncbi:MAG: hypothetical protein ABJL55_15155 [Roseibium sp.]
MKLSFSVICLIAGLSANTAAAKTVEIQTIEVSPSADSGQSTIPTDVIKGAKTGQDDNMPVEDPTEPDGAVTAPQVYYSTDTLPKPVARMRAQMREAALLGDIERLRIVFESNEVMPTLAFAEIDDPIDFLKQSSGDGEGFEILAILADTLDAGFVHVDVGTPQEMYVWPYFAQYPLHQLTPEQKVEMFRIVTAGDFAEMQDFGAWLFYRVGIGPDGTLHYFVAGD